MPGPNKVSSPLLVIVKIAVVDVSNNGQLSTVNCQLSTVNCQLSTVNCQLSSGNWQLTTENCQLPSGNWQLTTDNWQLTTVQLSNRPLTCILRISSLASVRSASSRSKCPARASMTPDSATPTSSLSRLSVTAAILSSRTGDGAPSPSSARILSRMWRWSSRREMRPAPHSRVLYTGDTEYQYLEYLIM